MFCLYYWMNDMIHAGRKRDKKRKGKRITDRQIERLNNKDW